MNPIINQQPTLSQSTQNLIRNENFDWKRPLFGCFDNWTLSITTKVLPCLTFGEVSHKSGYGDCCSHGLIFLCCPGVMTCLQRSHIRKRQGIKGNCVGDCLVGNCCTLCALCQHSHEVGAHYERPMFNGNDMGRM